MKTICAEDVIPVIKSFYKINKGDDSTTDIILAIGAELLNISVNELFSKVIDN